MSKFRGSQLLAKAVRAEQKHLEVIRELEDYLKDRIEFSFAIDVQPADGHMISNTEGSGMATAPAADCLSVIYMKGTLSVRDHQRLCI